MRVIQYLPDILYLQKLLFDQFHQRFDQGKALEMSIEEYLMTLNNGVLLFIDILFDVSLCYRSSQKHHFEVNQIIQ